MTHFQTPRETVNLGIRGNRMSSRSHLKQCLLIAVLATAVGFSLQSYAVGFADPKNQKQDQAKKEKLEKEEKTKNETKCKNLKAELDPNNVFATKSKNLQKEIEFQKSKIDPLEEETKDLEKKMSAVQSQMAKFKPDSDTVIVTLGPSYKTLKETYDPKKKELDSRKDKKKKYESAKVSHDAKLKARYVKLEKAIQKLKCN